MTRILTFAIVLMAANIAMAQAPGIPRSGGYRPGFRSSTTSPYLNLLRGNRNGNSFAFNYFQRVRPEQEFRRNAQNFNQSLSTLQQRVSSQERRVMDETGLTTTGHTAVFQNLGGYFPGLGGSGAALGQSRSSRSPARRSQAGSSQRR